MRPLEGRVALVTGVSRPAGIGATVARRLHDMGATVLATGFTPHDAEMAWGVQPLGDLPFEVYQHNLEDPATPGALVDQVIDQHGRLDVVVGVHARSSHGGLADVSADELDRCWAANVRSIVLLAQRFAAVHSPAPRNQRSMGRMLWFTSGQHLEPMDGEIAYAVSKGALHQMTASIDHALSTQRIVANCINPGPVDTGWAGSDRGNLHGQVADKFPDGKWGTPDDVANLVEFLVSDEGAWIRGQVLNSEGGFRRFRS